MASQQSTRLESDSDSTIERARFVFSEYRLVAYGALGILAVWMSGYIMDLLAGPYSESTELAHTISGLLGAAALVIAICGVLVAVLWAVLIVSNRRG